MPLLVDHTGNMYCARVALKADMVMGIDFVDQECKCVEDEMIELHAIPPGLDNLEPVPFFKTKQAPDDETVVTVDSLCMGRGKLDLTQWFEQVLQTRYVNRMVACCMHRIRI